MVLFATAAFCEVFKYDARGRRDPFVPLIGQDKVTVAGLSEITSVEDIKLEGIAIGAKGKKTAIINGEIVKVGAKTGEVEIKSIDHKSVTLTISGKEYKVSLSEEGGPKSE